MKTILTLCLGLLLAAPVHAGGASALRGSRASMARQNTLADREHLTRLKDSRQLIRFEQKRLLVPAPRTKAVKVDRRLDAKYTWCRPETRKFLAVLGTDFRKKFKRSLQVNSLVRTVNYQVGLRSRNGNAASVLPGPGQSAHLTGAAIDITKKGMSRAQLAWMRARLTKLERRGTIEATEERRQPVFHIMVFDMARMRHPFDRRVQRS